MVSLTAAYGRGLRRMSRRRKYHCRSCKSEIRTRCPLPRTDEKAVDVWHIYDGPTFGTVFVAGVESNVIFDVELPQSFVVL